MKKVLFGILFVAISCFLVFTIIKVNQIKKNNQYLNNEITNYNNNINTITEENENDKKEIETLKEKNKDKLEELAVWQETKEKLKKAIS